MGWGGLVPGDGNPPESFRQVGGRWEVAGGEATVLFALGFEGPRAL